MATASHISLSTSHNGEFQVPELKQDAVDKVSNCLQENHDQHHIFFNQEGFHNHVAHHLLTLFALGANSAEIQRQYDYNKVYQRRNVPWDQEVVHKLHDRRYLLECLGKEEYYVNLLVFFQEEITKESVPAVCIKYLLQKNDVALELLQRMFAGKLPCYSL